MLTLAKSWLMAIVLFAIMMAAAGSTFMSVTTGHWQTAIGEGFCFLFLFVAVCTVGYNTEAASEGRWGCSFVASLAGVAAICTETYLVGFPWVGIVTGFSVAVFIFGAMALIGIRFREIIGKVDELTEERDGLLPEKTKLQQQLEELQPLAVTQAKLQAAEARTRELEGKIRSWQEEASNIADTLDGTSCAIQLVLEVRSSKILE
jgi:hypothetical protein